MSKIVIVGGSGFGKEVIWLAQDCGNEILGVLDDNLFGNRTYSLGVPVLGAIDDWRKYSDCEFVVAVGDPRTRCKIVKKMRALGEPNFGTLIHPRTEISSTVSVGAGSIICAGCIITVDITIGEHCILNLNVTVGHDTVIQNFVTVAPMVAISGNVTLDNNVEVGTGATIRQGVRIMEGAMLGMGGVLTKNIPENTIFIGNPAKKFKEI